MIDTRVVAGSGAAGFSVGDLRDLVDKLGRLATPSDDAGAVAVLEELERVKGAVAAAQAVTTATLARRRRAEVEPARERAREEGRAFPNPEAGIGAEVGLARRESPYQGRRHLELADALTTDLPHTLAALARGDLSEDRAMTIATETAPLSAQHRRTVDRRLAGQAGGLGDARLRDLVRQAVYAVDPEGATDRWQRARAGRRVTFRGLRDGTARISAVVKAEHAQAVRSALATAARGARAQGDQRSPDQLKADLLVERATTGSADSAGAGVDTTVSPGVAVNLVLSAETLLGGDQPGQIPGIGPVPAPLCRDLVRRAWQQGTATLRRLFARPEDGTLVGMESKHRIFPDDLGELICFRDGGTCRTPWCNGRIRHRDHIVAVRNGGKTSYRNGQGLCEACNYIKETPGWTARVDPDAPGHRVHTRTASGREYTSDPPDPPWRTPGRPPSILTMELYHTDLRLIA